MNKRTLFAAVILIVLAAAVAVAVNLTKKEGTSPAGLTEASVRKLVADFGSKMKNVPLTAPKEQVIQAIKDNYGPFISPDLLAAWEAAPERAPGRLTSSPWPDRIEIAELTQEDDGAYTVQGFVIEITSTEVVNGGMADKYPVAMKVRELNGKPVITGFTKALPHAQ